MARFLNLRVAVVLACGLMAFKASYIAGALYANIGALGYAHVVSGIGHADSDLSVARGQLEVAVQLDGGIVRWRELLGVIYHTQGLEEKAQQQLQQAVLLALQEQRAWAVLGEVYDELGQPSLAVAAFEQGGQYASQERLLTTRMQWAEAQIQAGEIAAARANLDRIVALAPDALWAWAQLTAPPLGPVPEALEKTSRYRLSHMTDERQGRFLALAAVQLLDQGVWKLDDGLNAVGMLLVRDWPAEASIILRKSKMLMSEDRRVTKAQAEIATESGDLAQAAALWEHLTSSGNLAEKARASCNAAAQWYSSGDWQRARVAFAQCLGANPNDQRALVGLSGVCDVLGDTRCAAESVRHIAELSIRNTVAGMLGVASDQVILGPNLVDNGDFEDRDLIKPWLPRGGTSYIWDGFQHDRAAFYMDLDRRSWSGHAAVVIMGLWRKDTELNSGAYAELFAPPVLIPAKTTYVLSLHYKTDDLRGLVLVRDGRTESLTFLDTKLPGTDGGWKQVVLVGENPLSEAAYIRPQFRLWGLGTVWFDQVQASLLILPSAVRRPLSISIR